MSQPKEQFVVLEDELARLRRENAHLKDLLNVAPAFFGLISLQGRVEQINDLAVQVIECSAEDVLGKLFWECPWWKGLPHSSHRIRTAVEDALRGRASRFEIDFQAVQQGRYVDRLGEVAFTPQRNAQGRVYRVGATGMDITDRVHGDRQVVDVLESMAEAFFSMDAEFRITRVNRHHEKITQKPRHEQLGRYFFDVFPHTADPSSVYWLEYHRAMRDRVSIAFEAFYAPLGVWAAVRAYPTSDGGLAVFFQDITEQKNAACRTEAERQRFEAIFVDSPAAMALFRGPALTFERVNDKWTKLVSQREYIGKTHDETYPELVGTPLPGLLRQVYETGESYAGDEMKVRVEAAPGVLEDRFYDFTYTRICDGQANPYGVYCHALNVTERVLARRKVEEAQNRLQLALESAQMGTWQIDLLTNTVEASAQACKIAGSERIHGDIFEIIDTMMHPDDRADVNRIWLEAVRDHKAYEHEYRIVNPDGRVRWILSRGNPTYDESGRPRFLSGVIIDVTAQKTASEAIRESEVRFRQLADAMPQCVWTSDPLGFVDYFNRGWYELTGAEPSQGDESWMPHLHPDDQKTAWSSWYRSVRLGVPLQGEMRFLDKVSGLFRWHLVRSVPARDEKGAIVKWFGTCTDIQDVKQIQEELERSNQELARFAFVASHDLKEPLRVVSNYSQMFRLVYKDKLGANAETYIKYIVEGVNRMYALINDLLSYSGVGSDPQELQRIDCNEVLGEALSNLRTSIEESGAQVTATPLPSLPAQRSQWLQLFQNLVGNAIKYRGDEAPRIHIAAEQVSDGWIFSVEDNGIGIDPQFSEKIFQLFQRLHPKEKFSGTGIGLAVCKKIVERHGGKIWVAPSARKGSTFRFQIPTQSSRERSGLDS